MHYAQYVNSISQKKFTNIYVMITRNDNTVEWDDGNPNSP